MCKWAKIAEACMAAFPAETCSYAAALRLTYITERLVRNLRSGQVRRGAYKDTRQRLRGYRDDLVCRMSSKRWPNNDAPPRTHLPVWRGKMAVGRSSLLDESSVDRFVSPYPVKLIREAFPNMGTR
jgi:hypothetical protein